MSVTCDLLNVEAVGVRDDVRPAVGPDTTGVAVSARLVTTRTLERRDVVLVMGDHLREQAFALDRLASLGGYTARWLIGPDQVERLRAEQYDAPFTLEVRRAAVLRGSVPVWSTHRVREALRVGAPAMSAIAPDGAPLDWPAAELVGALEVRVALSIEGGPFPAHVIASLLPQLTLVGARGEVEARGYVFREQDKELSASASFGPDGLVPGDYHLEVGLADQVVGRVALPPLVSVATARPDVRGPRWVTHDSRDRVALVSTVAADRPVRDCALVASLPDGPAGRALVAAGLALRARGPGGELFTARPRAETRSGVIHLLSETRLPEGVPPGAWTLELAFGAVVLASSPCDVPDAASPADELALARAPEVALLVGDRAERGTRGVAGVTRGLGLSASFDAKLPPSRSRMCSVVVAGHEHTRVARARLVLNEDGQLATGLLAVELPQRAGRYAVALAVGRHPFWAGVVELVDQATLVQALTLSDPRLVRTGAAEGTASVGPVVVRRELCDVELFATANSTVRAAGVELELALDVVEEASGKKTRTMHHVALTGSLPTSLRLPLSAARLRSCSGPARVEVAVGERVLAAVRVVVCAAAFRPDGTVSERPPADDAIDHNALRSLFEGPGPPPQ